MPDIRAVNLRAFPEEENDRVARLATDLLMEKTAPKIISLLAESEGAIVGHVGFSPVWLENQASVRLYILAPLAVMPGKQKQGIGSKLVERGLEELKALKAAAVFVYGDPGYYGRFGFTGSDAEGLRPPYTLQYPFGWQAMMLDDESGISLEGRLSVVKALRDPELW